MARSILSSLIGNSQISIIDEATQKPQLTGLKVVNIEIPSEAETSNQPMSVDSFSSVSVSANSQATDFQTMKIIRPSRMRIVALVSDISLLENIRSIFKDTTSTLSITTKGIIASSMTILTVDIEQTPGMITASQVTIELEQVEAPFLGSAFNPSQTADQSSYGLNFQGSQSTPFSPSDLFSNIMKNIGQ
jgi:hypothetical protein